MGFVFCLFSVARVSVAPPPVSRSSNTFTHAPTLLKRLTEPLKPQKANATTTPTLSPPPPGGAIQHTVMPETGEVFPQQQTHTAVTQPTFSMAGPIPAQGHMPVVKPTTNTTSSTPTPKVSKVAMKKPAKGKKPASKNILPRTEPVQSNVIQSSVNQTVGNYPTIVPKNLADTQYTTQDVLYSTIDPQTNTETKVMVKTLLAKKIRSGNVIITQPGVVNVNDINSSQLQGDSQFQLQYQTPYSQPVQQTTYIQYNSPAPQNSVQTIIQPNQTSQLQTYVVQPQQVFVQSHPQASSLQQTQFIQQPIIQQQPVVAQQQIITQQQPIIAQQQTVFTQQPYVAQQQVIAPQVMSQPQYVTTYQPQITASFQQSSNISLPSDNSQGAEFTSQNIVHSSQALSVTQNNSGGSQSILPQPENQTNLVVCGEVAKDNVQDGTETMADNTDNNNEQNENADTRGELNLPSSNEIQSDMTTTDIVSEALNRSLGDLEEKPENQSETLNVSAAQNELDVSAAESELESAVGSILDEDNQYESNEPVNQEGVYQNSDQTYSEVQQQNEELVMIENDGNELMFENNVSDQVNNSVNNYSIENQEDSVENPEKDLIEAAAAIEELEKSQHEQENDENMEIESSADVNMGIGVDEPQETEMNVEEQNYFGIEGDNGKANNVMVNGDIAEETSKSDIMSCVSKFRPEVLVPSVAENGLFEQDFEARMAVENLLKDVEFNVNGDELSPSEENIMFSCQQQSDPPSVQTVNSTADENSDAVCQNSMDNIISNDDKSNESQSNNVSSKYVNGITESKPDLTQKTMNHITVNGDVKPLMNGNISSPEHHSDSVPSPTYDTKIEECIKGGKESIRTVDKISKLNGVVNHNISKNEVLQTNNVNEIKVEGNTNCKSEVKNEEVKSEAQVVTSCENDSTRMEVENADSNDNKAQGDILAQSILENDIQPSDADIPDTEPALIPVVKQFVPNQIIGNIMTVNCVQINNNAMTVPVVGSNCIAFTNNPMIASKVQLSSPVSVYTSQNNSTLVSYKTAPSVKTDVKLVIAGKHSSLSPKGSKDKGLTSPDGRPKSGDGKKSKSAAAKKRSRSKSGGGSSDSRPSSATSSTPAPAPPEFMCEWSQCRR